MAQAVGGTAVSLLEEHDLELWLAAIAFFVVGDVVTTGLGYRLEGVFEASPLPALLLSEFGVLALLGLKLAVVACCYLLWVVLPRQYAIGIPLGIALMGLVATGWNATILVSATA